ncbi:MAG: tetratricopeptide repeat protein [Gammaproteobacteria bacterium]
MKRRRSIVKAVIIAACVAGTVAVYADYGAGVAAYKEGDYVRALTVFSPLAEAGDARAQFALGLLFDNGEGTPRDDAAAFAWYRKSAAQGFAKAQYNLALMCEARRAVCADSARDWFARAALRGNADAVTRLRGYASAGDVEAALQLGRMYTQGRGVARDPRAAYAWFEQAATAGHADAAFALGVLHEQGVGVAQSYAEAARWYARAAEQGQVQAQFNLARLYRLGRGVAADQVRARTLYEAAAEAGLVSAQLSLAMLFEAGRSWPQDPALALSWYQRAARGGSVDAQINLAFIYAEGRGVERDLIEACALLHVASERQTALARDNHAVLCADLDPAARRLVDRRAEHYRGETVGQAARVPARSRADTG